MAQVEWADAIKTVSGALTKINKKSQHAADQKMILATHRKAATTNPNCSRLYMRGLSSVSRSTPVGPDELAARARFKAVRQAVYSRAHSLTTLSQDQAAYQAQLGTAEGKSTFNAYLWQVCGDAYDAEHPRS